MSPVHQVWPKPSCKAQWKGEEDKANRGRGGKTTSGNGQAWSSASPRGQWSMPQRPSRLRDRWWWWWWWYLYICRVWVLNECLVIIVNEVFASNSELPSPLFSTFLNPDKIFQRNYYLTQCWIWQTQNIHVDSLELRTTERLQVDSSHKLRTTFSPSSKLALYIKATDEKLDKSLKIKATSKGLTR